VERKRDALRTRARIMAAAKTHFARSGFTGTSMRAIAKDAEVRAASMYHYFPSKKRMADELFAEYFTLNAAFFDRFLLGLSARTAFLGALSRFFKEYRVFARENRELVSLFLAESFKPTAAMKGHVKVLSREYVQKLKAIAGYWENIPEQHALTLFAAYMGLALFLETGEGFFKDILGLRLSFEEQQATLGDIISGQTAAYEPRMQGGLLS